MKVRILGPVQAADDPWRPVLGEPKPHALLAVLLLHASPEVPTDRLIDELWVEAKDHAEQWSKPHLLGARSRAPPDQGAARTRPPTEPSVEAGVIQRSHPASARSTMGALQCSITPHLSRRSR
jgi:hypothetical protein